MSEILSVLLPTVLVGLGVWSVVVLVLKLSFDLGDLWDRRIEISERRVRNAVDDELDRSLRIVRTELARAIVTRRTP